MLGQLWKRVGTYDRELGRQGKQIPLPSRRHRHRTKKTAFLSPTDKRTIGRWALIAGPLAILAGLGSGALLATDSMVKSTPPPLTIPLPTFDSQPDSIPCARLVAFSQPASGPESTEENSSNTVEPTQESPSSSVTPTSSPSTSAPDVPRKVTSTTRQSSTQKSRPPQKDRPEGTEQSAAPLPPQVVLTQVPQAPRVNPTIPEQSQALIQQERQGKPKPWTSTPISPRQMPPRSIPKQEQGIPTPSTMPSSDSSAKPEKSPTNGRSTSVMVLPSKSCSHS